MKSSHRQAKRIFMTADTVGGVWNFAIELCRELSEKRILLATMGAPLSEAQMRQVASLRHVELEESGYRLEWMDDPWADVDRAGKWLLELAENFQPDVIHLNGYVHATLPFPAPVAVTAHSCVLSWWQAVRGTPLPDSWSEYRRRVTSGLHAASEVIAPTAAMMRAIHEHYGKPRRSRIVSNGIGPTAARRSSQAHPMKQNCILSVGRLWDEAKNIACLAEIAGSLPWPVELVGDPGSIADSWRNVPNLYLLGQLGSEDLERRYRAVAIYVHPARYEPFGLAVLEAAMAGCALVLGDIPTLREIWGEAAIYVNPSDPQRLHQTLLDLISDDSLRRSLGQLARRRAAVFTGKRMASGYLSVYADLLRNAHFATS